MTREALSSEHWPAVYLFMSAGATTCSWFSARSWFCRKYDDGSRLSRAAYIFMVAGAAVQFRMGLELDGACDAWAMCALGRCCHWAASLDCKRAELVVSSRGNQFKGGSFQWQDMRQIIQEYKSTNISIQAYFSCALVTVTSLLSRAYCILIHEGLII
jgi:hypothetical protein